MFGGGGIVEHVKKAKNLFMSRAKKKTMSPNTEVGNATKTFGIINAKAEVGYGVKEE